MRMHALVTIAPLLAACHSYVSLSTPAPRPGSYVAATLTESGSTELTDYLGANAGVVRGRLLDDGQAGMTLSVQSVGLRRGYDLSWSGESVTLPHASIARVDERRVSKVRSVLLAMVAATGFVVLLRAFDLSASGTSSRVIGGPGSTPQ
jgi:hypothetical protein